MRAWTVRDSLELYNVPNWGRGFFGVNDKGHVEVRARGADGPAIDLLSLVQDLQGRGVRTPMLVRFSDILAARVQSLKREREMAVHSIAKQRSFEQQLERVRSEMAQ